MNVCLLVGRLVLAVVFAIAGITKVLDPVGSRKSLLDFGVPRNLAMALAWFLPLAELLCAVLLVPLGSAWYGAAGSLLLLLFFIGAIAVSLIRGRRPDCHCFGQLHSSPVGWQTLLRNAVLASVAACIIWEGPTNPGASIIAWTHGMNGTTLALAAVSIAIAALAAFQLWALVHVLRQNGRLLLRLEAVEAKSGGIEAPAPGLPINTEAPAFALPDLEGNTVTSDMLRQRGTALVLMFTEPGCSACDAALPEIAEWQREYSARMSIVLVSRGSAADNRAKTAKSGVRGVLLQTDREVAEAYRVEATPSAVLINDGRIESSLAAGLDEIRGLVARAALPPAVNTGDPVPSLRLADLTGKLVDLAELGYRRTLMLFWSPSCGFCQQMLEDLKKWESNRREQAPELVVISTGSPADNRHQGFRSRVLLDPYYAASQVFNSGGTPSAVLVEDGKVTSNVAVGAQAVLALAGALPA